MERPAIAVPAAPVIPASVRALIEKARQFNLARIEEAEDTSWIYGIVYAVGKMPDGTAQKVKIKRPGADLAHTYEVDRMAGTCTCPGFKHHVLRLRAQLVEAGMGAYAPYVMCKHVFMAECILFPHIVGDPLNGTTEAIQ